MGWWLVLGCSGLLAGCSGLLTMDEDDDPDDGAAVCSTHAACDDGDPCTADLCDLAAGECRTSRLDACAEPTLLLEEDFESRPGDLVDDAALFGDDWRAERAPGCPVGLDVALDDPFERYKAGPLAHGEGGWAIAAATGGTVQVVGDPAGDGLALDVRNTATAGSYAQAAHQVTARARGSVELRFRPAGATRAKWIGLNEGDEARFLLHFDADGVIRYRDGGTKIALGPYEGARWYTIGIDWDAATDRADITLDGVKHAGLGLNQPIDEFIDRVRVRTATGTGLSFLVDDVVVTGPDAARKRGAASLRIGEVAGGCAEPTTAARALPPVLSGALAFDLLARGGEGPHIIRVAAAGDPDGGLALSLDPDGRVRWQVGEGEERTTLPVDTAWTPGSWLRLELRWDAAGETADLWLDGVLVAVGLRPVRPLTALPDQLRVTAAAGGAVWIDDLRIYDAAAAAE